MKKLLVFLKDYKKETVLAPLFKMLEAGFELFVPLVMAGWPVPLPRSILRQKQRSASQRK